MSDATMDVVVSFDTTGSMYGCLAEVRKGAKALVERLFKEIPGLRMGVMAHGDYSDAKRTYLLKKVDLTDDKAAVLKFIKGVPRTAGGDAPEAYEYALHEARGLAWREGAGRVLVMIGDEVPHAPDYKENEAHLDWEKELEALAEAGVKIYGVQARAGGNTPQKKFYKSISERTGGTYLTLQQLKNSSDMLLGIAMHERGGEHLSRYAAEVARARRMDRGLSEAYSAMLGRELTEAEATGRDAASPDAEAPAPKPRRPRSGAKATRGARKAPARGKPDAAAKKKAAAAKKKAAAAKKKATAARVRARKAAAKLRVTVARRKQRVRAERRSLSRATAALVRAGRLLARRRKARASLRARVKVAQRLLTLDLRRLSVKRREAAGKPVRAASKAASSARKAPRKATRKAPARKRAASRKGARRPARRPSTRKKG
ncbi:MAG: VWA domain-containing protein [Deltaproteobacteria bacterium]|nr:VWA domain-containing protein [Deltaproteobacteria bacterium]